MPADRAEPLLPVNIALPKLRTQLLTANQFTFNEVELRHKSSRSSNDMLGKFLKLHNARQDNLSMRELTAAVFINLYDSQIFALFNLLTQTVWQVMMY